MRIEVKITRKQAERLADNLVNGGFWVAGFGHFDLSRDQLIDLLLILFNEKEKDVSCFYDKINPLR